ncbi:hypothetical protein EYF80_022459 [Liparis tanakae]|uniref:Uncharacterized protein n=1 Tax=Liparis tanakae TaxID=230148 RepID=A0A4Z2HRD6_9TELE|nr:hypothetical protein EYF80_022459 [Liparis tanakae]
MLTCMDGPDDVLLRLHDGDEGHHHPHGAGQGLLRAVAAVDRLSRLAQHEHVFPVAPPRLAAHVLLFGPTLRGCGGVAVLLLRHAVLRHREILSAGARRVRFVLPALSLFLGGQQILERLRVDEHGTLLAGACRGDVMLMGNFCGYFDG